MASKASGVSAAPASAAIERLRELLGARAVLVAEHTVTQAALSADDHKWRLSAVVARAYADATEDERMGAVLAVLTANDPNTAADTLLAQRLRDTGPALMILGPGTDTPGHPAWCERHDAEVGDGTSVCSGTQTEIVEDLDDPHTPRMGANLVQSTGQAARMFIDAHNDGSVSLAAAREYAELLLELIAQAEAEAGSAVSA